MLFSNILFRLRSLNEDIELISIMILLIFFPEKSSFYYFLIFAILMIIFLIRKIIISKNIGISNFTKVLFLTNILLLFSTIFSIYFQNSLLFFFDIFLISSYFILHLIEERDDDRNIRIIGGIISIFSFLSIIFFFITGSRDLFFLNPIMAGITSGIAVLIYLYRFIKQKNYFEFLLIFLNLISLFISESKAAFMGISLCSLLLVLSKRKKAVPVVLILIILTLLIPNPIRNMFHYSISIDPYASNRIDIWNTGLKIFKDNIFIGTGADNFNELSKRYNFKQKNGPANYFKVPRTPHSDYIKLIAELGLWGILILLFSLFFIFRRILTGSLFDISKILILYLLFQALFFNIIFQTLFFFLFIFLLKTMFKGEIIFQSNSRFFRLISISILILVIIIGYIFPYYSELLVKKARGQKEIISIFDTLNRAEKFNKLNIGPYYYRSLLLLEQFKRTSDPVYFYASLDDVKNIQRINPGFTEAYLLESEIYQAVLNKGIRYPSLLEEIISPLRKLEYFDPYNPFVKMEKASILLRFEKPEMAKHEAIGSVELEPKFISALFFLQKNFNHFGTEEKFRNRIRSILKSSESWPERKSPYLNSLIKIPAGLELPERIDKKNFR